MRVELWAPSAERVAASNMERFRQSVERDWAETLPDYAALHAWSIAEREKFWVSLWDFVGIKASARGDGVFANKDLMPGCQHFPNARLNFAENLLKHRDDQDAIVFWGEDKARRRMTRRQLYDAVSVMAQALAASGVGQGDRVAAMLPNLPETVVAMLATASLGGVFSSCSPDFGAKGVLDRFGQIEPTVLIVCDGYWYGGKFHDVRDKAAQVGRLMPTLRQVVVVPYLDEAADVSGIPNAVRYGDYVAPYRAGGIGFTQVEFNDPLYILFSSGTTGAPKCIVHSVGGMLIQHMKEQQLHCDIKPGDRVFWFTTCGWMMWNWLVTALASDATLLLYDGSPFHPSPNVLFDLADAEGMTWFGTSAKYIDALKKEGVQPKDSHTLTTVRAIGSTGSVLVPESFDYVYEAVKPDVHLASVSGGTDICACFVGGNPTAPVYRGEIQVPILGHAVEVWNDAGEPVVGEKGELVCTKPFPSMPIGFWNDEDGSRYRAAYYARFPGVWAHGDFMEVNEHGGIIIYGRSDATLNPGGVRIGTAEIYRQVEQLPEVLESVAIGQDWDGDVRVVLFVRLAEGVSLDDALIKTIKTRIREGASPRHVPAKILAVDDIPRTKSGKITELAIRDLVHGREIRNREALANPEARDAFMNRPELAE